MNDMSKPHDQVKAQFCSTASALTQLFKMSMELEKHSYNEGRKDSYTDILGWLLTHGNGELKNIPISTFIAFLQSKLDSCSADNPEVESQEESVLHPQYDISKLNLSGIKIADRIKRMPPKSSATEENGTITMEDTEVCNRKVYSFKKKRIDFD